jgi:predicted AAA+ superfamily ATPase/ribonuclease HI
MKEVTIYTDGACSGNPGPGGWAAVLLYNEHKKEISGGEEHTTNNRMEMMAVIEGLKQLKEPCRVSLYSDSAYLINGFKKKWIDKWQRNGWQTAGKKPVENRDLWEPRSKSMAEFPGHQQEIKEKLYYSSSWSDCLPDLACFYREMGAGIFAQYYAFIWERNDTSGFFKGVASPDPVKLADLYSYERERREVLENTLQFLKGYQANNVLLYGDRGTGKSSTVKALVNEYHGKGLRIIEVPKGYLSDFPEIIRLLRGRSQKFIIFVDDLTFDDSTANYTALKAVLEGGLESRPSNVVIYATSNRRHLVKERFSDRPDSLDTDEIHKNDSVQEKLSLADRFGITVIFTAPDQDRYLEIASALAEQRGLQVQQNILKKEALKWANRHNGRSPRTAHQFIDWLEGHLS